MPRKLRLLDDDGIFHVINRRAARQPLFDDEPDYQAFIKVLSEVLPLYPVRLLSYSLMPNHWHLLLWPRRGKSMPAFMQRLAVTHMRRWHAHRQSTGAGPLYQGRYKSFPVQDDEHLLTVARYIERNPLRANLVKRAQDWKWCSLRDRMTQTPPTWLTPAENWPLPLRRDWTAWVNRAETAAELDALRTSVNRGRPFGDPRWQQKTAAKLDLKQTLRDPGRPPKTKKNKKGSGSVSL